MAQLAAVEPMTGAVKGTEGLITPPPKFGFFESCLAAVAVGGAAGAATTSLSRGWDPKVSNPTIAKSFQSARQVKLIAPKIKGNTVMQGAQFYAGVTVAYVFTERMVGGMRGQYDWVNSVPASLAAGMAIGMKKGCASTAFGMAGAIFWTNYILKEAGSGGLETKAADAYYYYGAGDAGRERWQASKKAQRETWLKAPYKDPAAGGGDDY